MQDHARHAAHDTCPGAGLRAVRATAGRRTAPERMTGQPIPDDALPHLISLAYAVNSLYDDSARYELERRWVAELRDQARWPPCWWRSPSSWGPGERGPLR
jgi:hypothetical protein